MVTTRTDSHSIATDLTIILYEDDDVPESSTEAEYVKLLAEMHIDDEYNSPRGSVQVCVEKENEFDSKTVYVATATVMQKTH